MKLNDQYWPESPRLAPFLWEIPMTEKIRRGDDLICLSSSYGDEYDCKFIIYIYAFLFLQLQ